jgi:5-methylcytosine-specific restriction endonuclease McrA
MPRNYQKEYENYQGKPSQIKKRAMRNKARRTLEKEGRVHKGDGMDVDHKRPLDKGGSNDRGNLRVVKKSKNRSFKRDKDAGMK